VADSSDRLITYQRRATIPVSIATLCVVPVLIFEGSSNSALAAAAQVLNWASWLVLAAHVGVVLAIGGVGGLRLAWLDVLLVVVSVPIAPSLLGATRLLRLVRVLRLGVALSATIRHARTILQHRQFHFVALVAVAAVGLGGLGIYLVEGGENTHIQSFGDGVWWAIVTVTTVGYGDISPTTTEGRVIATCLMLLGIGVIGAFTATVASFFVQQDEGAEMAEIEARLERIERKLDALARQRDAGVDAGPTAAPH
jgi:voltage-gated potassium channel